MLAYGLFHGCFYLICFIRKAKRKRNTTIWSLFSHIFLSTLDIAHAKLFPNVGLGYLVTPASTTVKKKWKRLCSHWVPHAAADLARTFPRHGSQNETVQVSFPLVGSPFSRSNHLEWGWSLWPWEDQTDALVVYIHLHTGWSWLPGACFLLPPSHSELRYDREAW